MANATKAHRNLNMLDLTGYGRLAELTKLTDKMISEASKGAIVDAARMLAIQVGHYQRKFGALPLEDAIDLLETKALNEDQATWVADGLENLAIAIASVKDDEQPPTVQLGEADVTHNHSRDILPPTQPIRSCS
jgi:hypothetical protein